MTDAPQGRKKVYSESATDIAAIQRIQKNNEESLKLEKEYEVLEEKLISSIQKVKSFYQPIQFNFNADKLLDEFYQAKTDNSKTIDSINSIIDTFISSLVFFNKSPTIEVLNNLKKDLAYYEFTNLSQNIGSNKFVASGNVHTISGNFPAEMASLQALIKSIVEPGFFSTLKALKIKDSKGAKIVFDLKTNRDVVEYLNNFEEAINEFHQINKDFTSMDTRTAEEKKSGFGDIDPTLLQTTLAQAKSLGMSLGAFVNKFNPFAKKTTSEDDTTSKTNEDKEASPTTLTLQDKDYVKAVHEAHQSFGLNMVSSAKLECFAKTAGAIEEAHNQCLLAKLDDSLCATKSIRVDDALENCAYAFPMISKHEEKISEILTATSKVETVVTATGTSYIVNGKEVGNVEHYAGTTDIAAILALASPEAAKQALNGEQTEGLDIRDIIGDDAKATKFLGAPSESSNDTDSHQG